MYACCDPGSTLHFARRVCVALSQRRRLFVLMLPSFHHSSFRFCFFIFLFFSRACPILYPIMLVSFVSVSVLPLLFFYKTQQKKRRVYIFVKFLPHPWVSGGHLLAIRREGLIWGHLIHCTFPALRVEVKPVGTKRCRSGRPTGAQPYVGGRWSDVPTASGPSRLVRPRCGGSDADLAVAVAGSGAGFGVGAGAGTGALAAGSGADSEAGVGGGSQVTPAAAISRIATDAAIFGGRGGQGDGWW